MDNNDIEAQRRRKGAPPTDRADAPGRDTGSSQGGMGGGFQPPSGGFSRRGKQIGGGCGSILVLLIIVAIYLFSNGQIDLSGISSDQSLPQDSGYSQSEPLNYPSNPESNFTPPIPASGAGQTWTVMLYQDADDQTLEKDIFIDFNEVERVGSSDRVHIVAQMDRFSGAFSGDGNWTGTRRYYLTQDNELNRIHSQVMQDLGEVNMADGNSLADFIEWGVKNYPADKYMLILSDHGMGWPGGWSDPDPGGRDRSSTPLSARLGDNIYLMELENALAAGRQAAGIDKFELIGLDACLMAQMEVMTALEPHARYAVASEEVEPSLGWAYAAFLGDLVRNPDMDGAQLGKSIVDSYIADDQRITDPAARADFLREGSSLGGSFGYSSGSEQQVLSQLEQEITISAVDLSAFPALLEGLNNFAYTLQNEDQQLIAQAREYTQSYTSIFGRQVPPSYIDLGHFALLLENNTSSSRVKQAADQLVSDLQRVIIAEKHGEAKNGSTGLAIYFPNSTLYSTPVAGPQSYNTIASSFVASSLWDDFLAYHYLDRSFEDQLRSPYIPAEGYTVRSPGLGDIQVSEIRVSSTSAAPGSPVRLSVDIRGENIGYIYLFVGYLDPQSNSIAVLDTDYLESPDTRELNGVYYPLWGSNFTMSFNWDPVIFAINDGQTSRTALFLPQSFGASSALARYAVDGVYTFADSGASINARLYFQNEELVQVFGLTGEGDAGAPHEIIPQSGDAFTLLEKWLEPGPGGELQTVYEQGSTVSFGTQPFKWEQLYAAAGDYVVGFVIEDLDGNQYPVYTSITVR